MSRSMNMVTRPEPGPACNSECTTLTFPTLTIQNLELCKILSSADFITRYKYFSNKICFLMQKQISKQKEVFRKYQYFGLLWFWY